MEHLKMTSASEDFDLICHLLKECLNQTLNSTFCRILIMCRNKQEISGIKIM